jgi:hypothetical protein
MMHCGTMVLDVRWRDIGARSLSVSLRLHTPPSLSLSSLMYRYECLRLHNRSVYVSLSASLSAARAEGHTPL